MAVSETRLAAIKHESFKRAQQQDPSISDQVIKTLARRLRHSNEALADLVFSDVPGRLAKALLDLADRFGRPQPTASSWPTSSLRKSLRSWWVRPVRP